MIVTILAIGLSVVVAILLIYTIRHYIFTLNRLIGRHRQPYVDIGVADWPLVTVLIPAHNEEQVIEGMLDALLAADYPTDRLQIVPINDRSSDATGAILDRYAAEHPRRITPYHRTDGMPGKAAALADASQRFAGDIHLVFDADYLPGKGLLKQLVAPFFDPEVGAVMGRVVPHNLNRNLLTRLLDLERSGGYQVDQQARMNLRLVPQYGGTVGGVRRSALEAVGGWRADCLAEDTDMTFRLVLQGWEVVYQNRSECYEEVPEQWPTRIRQVMRWTKGHNQSLVRYGGALLRFPRRMPVSRAIDGLLLLGVFAVGPILLFGWVLALTLYFLGASLLEGPIAVLSVAAFGTLGNFAAFFEVATATRLDGTTRRVRLLPFLAFGFLVNLLAVSRATASPISWIQGSPMRWDKTERYRSEEANQ